MGIEPLPITAGETEIIRNSAVKKNPDEWLIVDIGYAMITCSCGVWTAEGGSRTVSFGGLVKLMTNELQKKDAKDLNLVIEAPLSVAFQENGNPTMRVCDRFMGKPRPYYTNAGATTFIAAHMLFRELRTVQVRRTVNLFEGFLSFKSSGWKSDHIEDVRKMKTAIWTGRNCKVFAPADLPTESNHRMESAAFPFLDISLIPPVIRLNSEA